MSYPAAAQVRQASPQTPPADVEPAPDEHAQEIQVTARRPRGSVIGDIVPEATLSPVDLSAYGANNIDDLISALGPRVASGPGQQDGRPIVLLNGRRISGFDEISSIPSNAIERLEIFPEDLALSYGYKPGQKVVNVVLFNRFESQVAQFGYAVPTEGGRDSVTGGGNYFRIRGATRYTFDVDFSKAGAVTESERGVQQLPENVGLGAFRTLLPRTGQGSVNGTIAGTLFSNVAATLNGKFVDTSTESLLGMQGGRLIRQRSDTGDFHLGTSLTGSAKPWLWSTIVSYDRSRVTTATGVEHQDSDNAPARFTNDIVDSDLNISGPLFGLPAGAVRVSLTAGVRARYFSSSSSADSLERSVNLSRRSGVFRASFDLPLTSARNNGLTKIGTLTANANLGFERLSDFGLLKRSGYGLRWSPSYSANVYLDSRNEEIAPTVVQIGAPPIATPNVTSFDFATGETNAITLLSGGNVNLRPIALHETSMRMDFQLLKRKELLVSFDYTDTRTNNPIMDFPIGISQVEAAFPDRFTRGVDGRLLKLDVRPLNFLRSAYRRARMGLNFTRTLGALPPLPPGERSVGLRVYSSEEAAKTERSPDVRMVEVRPGSPAAKRLENLTSRITLGLYYTFTMKDEVTTVEAGPVLDFLNGAAKGITGGTPRHQIEAQAGLFKRGLGVRLIANWRSGTGVRDFMLGGRGENGRLNFSPYASANLSFFANVADRVGIARSPNWLKGVTISFSVENVFDSRPRVRDGGGSTPLRYQPQYISPLGRTFSLSIRKLFRS